LLLPSSEKKMTEAPVSTKISANLYQNRRRHIAVDGVVHSITITFSNIVPYIIMRHVSAFIKSHHQAQIIYKILAEKMPIYLHIFLV
jgi:hypothetical protein